MPFSLALSPSVWQFPTLSLEGLLKGPQKWKDDWSKSGPGSKCWQAPNKPPDLSGDCFWTTDSGLALQSAKPMLSLSPHSGEPATAGSSEMEAAKSLLTPWAGPLQGQMNPVLPGDK